MTNHTVATLIETVCERFESGGLTFGHGTDNPWDEAVALVLTVTGHADDRSSLAHVLKPDEVARCLTVADARVETRQPLAHLLGECRYMGMRFVVEPGVVVPRSPIGYLLHEGLAPWLPRTVDRILDLCTGTACLGIVAAHRFPGAEVVAVEVDPTALEVARRNVAGHGLTRRVQVVAGDVTAPLQLGERFDLVIANPPYVNAADMQTLPAEYRAEPAHGLGAGEQGLDVMAAILAQLPQLLTPGGLFIGEIGASARHLIERYPDLPLIWPDLPLGGEGVFLLEAGSLSSHTAPRS